MINLQPLPPPPATNIDLSYLTSMFTALSDPVESKKQLAAMLEARQAWAAAHAAAIEKMRESDARVADNQATISKAQAAHSAALRDERQKFDHFCATAMEEVRAARENAEKLLAQATADAEAAAKLKADLEVRIALIRRAGL
jgi:hypothetical protein